MNFLGSCVHYRSCCNFHRGHRYHYPDLHRSPTFHRDCGRVLCVNSAAVATNTSRNSDLYHQYSASECKHCTRDLTCSGQKIRCNVISSVHVGVHVNKIGSSGNILLSGIRCILLCSMIPSGVCGLPSTQVFKIPKLLHDP